MASGIRRCLSPCDELELGELCSAELPLGKERAPSWRSSFLTLVKSVFDARYSQPVHLHPGGGALKLPKIPTFPSPELPILPFVGNKQATSGELVWSLLLVSSQSFFLKRAELAEHNTVSWLRYIYILTHVSSFFVLRVFRFWLKKEVWRDSTQEA